MDPSDEIAVLRREVIALKRTVDALVELLHQGDAFGAMSRAQVDRRLAAAAHAAREQAEDEDAAGASPALVASAYRGTAPGAGGLACAVCRRGLAEDDPELVLTSRGRVCVACFHRGDGR